MNFLMELTSSVSGSHFPLSAVVVLVAGFVIAVVVGSVAWYNAKRPVGWEDKERPDFVPDIDKQ